MEQLASSSARDLVITRLNYYIDSLIGMYNASFDIIEKTGGFEIEYIKNIWTSLWDFSNLLKISYKIPSEEPFELQLNKNLDINFKDTLDAEDKRIFDSFNESVDLDKAFELTLQQDLSPNKKTAVTQSPQAVSAIIFNKLY